MKRTTLTAVVFVAVVACAAIGAYAYSSTTLFHHSPVVEGPSPVPNSTTSPSVPAQPGTQPLLVHAYGSVVLALGQSAKFADVTITPLSILQDSRCPVDVQCIQAGTVQVSVRITSASGTDTETLTLDTAFTAPAGTITLTGVEPAKHANGTIASGDYRLTFKVEKHVSASCYIGGCSAEVCSDAPGAVSSCIYRSSFACYRTAACERQSNGACGWTQTPALKSCLARPEPAL